MRFCLRFINIEFIFASSFKGNADDKSRSLQKLAKASDILGVILEKYIKIGADTLIYSRS